MEMEPEMPIPASFARSTAAWNPATLCAGVRFRFARLWATLAETFNFTFVQPQAMARSTPFTLAISARYSTPSFFSIPLNTSSVSAICGTALGLTKLPTSMTGKPARESSSMRAILSSVDTIFFSFCRPSRGPTSQRRIFLTNFIAIFFIFLLS